jgi:hypothetical protein
VGRGIYYDRDYDPPHMQQAPGRIQVTGKQGFHMVYKGLERYVASNAEYLSVLPGCSCTFEKCLQCNSMPFAVEVPSLSEELGLNFRSFWIDREYLNLPATSYPDTYGYDYVSIGKIDFDKSTVWYANSDGKEIERGYGYGFYDILTCKKVEKPVYETCRKLDKTFFFVLINKLFFKLSTDEWKPYSNEDFLGDGLNIGRFYVNYPEPDAVGGFAIGEKAGWVDLYVGRGILHFGAFNSYEQSPGRIQVVPLKGFYMFYRGIERYVRGSSNKYAEYLSVPQGCSCKFERCNNCTSMPYAVEVPALDGNETIWWISKEVIPLPSGLPCEGNATSCSYTSIGRVDNARSTVKYPNTVGIFNERTDGIYDILTCRKIVPTV